MRVTLIQSRTLRAFTRVAARSIQAPCAVGSPRQHARDALPGTTRSGRGAVGNAIRVTLVTTIAHLFLSACANTRVEQVQAAKPAVHDPAAAAPAAVADATPTQAPSSTLGTTSSTDSASIPPSQEASPNESAPQSTDANQEKDTPGKIIDPKDGYFDVSRFLDSRRGLLPFAMPITEPAVGYGAAAALVFFETPPRAIQTANGTRVIPPNTTAIAGFATENGSWGALAAHLHTWDEGRYRYIVAAGYASLNLDWFGRSDEFEGRSFSYNFAGTVVYQKFTTKIGDSDFFAGPIQRLLVTKTAFDNAASLPPIGMTNDEEHSTVSGLGLALAYDTRNSYFSPTRGTKAILNYT